MRRFIYLYLPLSLSIYLCPLFISRFSYSPIPMVRSTAIHRETLRPRTVPMVIATCTPNRFPTELPLHHLHPRPSLIICKAFSALSETRRPQAIIRTVWTTIISSNSRKIWFTGNWTWLRRDDEEDEQLSFRRCETRWSESPSSNCTLSVSFHCGLSFLLRLHPFTTIISKPIIIFTVGVFLMFCCFDFASRPRPKGSEN